MLPRLNILHRLRFCVTLWTLLLLSAVQVQADTTWVAAGSVSGEWDVENSPYVIHEGGITIDSGQTLTINPGVRVYFAGHFELRINGLLLAIGTAPDSIYFTSDLELNSLGWRGLRFIDAHEDCELVFCVIEGGRASGPGEFRFGGGGECHGSSPRFYRCTFRRNYALIDGGGFYILDNSNPSFARCHFYENVAGFGGGGIFIQTGSSPVISDCLIRDNEAAEGGGIASDAGSNPSIRECLILDNVAWLGGGFFCDRPGTAPILTNCLIQSNHADSTGGGVFLRNTGARLLHCVITDNSSPQASGIHLDDAQANVSSSIIAYADAGVGIHFDDSPETTIEYCDIFGHTEGDFTGSLPPGFGEFTRANLNHDSIDIYHNIFLNPRFLNQVGEDYHLTEDSPGIASGRIEPDLPDDFENTPRPRPVSTAPDMGMFEHQTGSPIQICGSVEGTLGPGEIVVTCDLLVEQRMTLGIAAGTELLFAGDFVFEVRGALRADGQDGQPILFSRFFPESDPFWGGVRFISSADGSRMRFCTIEFAHASAEADRQFGGGIYIEDSSPTFDDCLIRQNEAMENLSEGGGVYIHENSNPVFSNCTFQDNEVTLRGGGVSVGEGCSPVFSKCTFVGNECVLFGGAVYLHQSSASLLHCTVSGNTSQGNGGGIYSWWSSPVIENCTIIENSSATFGGGCYINSGSPQILCCTISENSAGVSGAGILCNQSTATINSSVIAFSDGYGIEFLLNNAGANISYCDIHGNTPQNFLGLEDAPDGLGINSTTNFNGDLCDTYLNIFLNPQFADTAGDDYGIDVESPCVNAGDPLAGIDPDSTIADIGVHSADFPRELSTIFNLLSPPDSMGVDATNLLLDWGVSLDPVTEEEVPLYRVQIAENSQFTSGVHEQIVDSSAARFVDLTDSTYYLWRVLAIGSTGSITWSQQTWNIYTVVANPPTPFDLLEPSDGDTLLITDSRMFRWQQSFDIDGGDFIVYTIKLESPDTLVIFSDLTDTLLNIVPTLIGLSQTRDVEWWVEASSNHPDTTVECNNRFLIYVLDTTSAASEFPELPNTFSIRSIHPNPFNASATIWYDVAYESDIRLTIYNVVGQEVALLHDGRIPSGRHRLVWQADDHSSGIFFLRMDSPSGYQIKKMVLMK